VLVRRSLLWIALERHDAIGEQLALVRPHADVAAAPQAEQHAHEASLKKQC
jgi:hypothetical protein